LALNRKEKNGLTIQIQNPILILYCQLQSNPPNWIAIRIEQSSNTMPTSSLINPTLQNIDKQESNEWSPYVSDSQSLLRGPLVVRETL